MLVLRVFVFGVTIVLFVFLIIAYYGAIISLDLLAPLFAIGAGLSTSIGRFPINFRPDSSLNEFISDYHSWMIWAFSGMAAFVWFMSALTIDDEVWVFLLIVPVVVLSVTIISHLMWILYVWLKEE